MGLYIKMTNLEDYEETYPYMDQKLVKKLIYFLCSTKLDIAFVVRQFSKQKVDLKKIIFKLQKE